MLKFIELDENKRPLNTFDIFSTTCEHMQNAGLLLNNNTVVIDFDNDNVNEEKIIKYILQRYPTLYIKTTRGIHLYYSKPKNTLIKSGADKITVGGFQVDYKTGNKSYTIVKQNGKMRESSEELRLNKLPVLPDILYPLPKTKSNLSGLKDGDGRNNLLFYHLRCIREMYRSLDITKIGNFINDNIFGQKFKDKELDALINSVGKIEVVNQEKYTGNYTDMIEFAQFLAMKLTTKIYNGVLYFNDGINYSCDEIELLKQINKYLKIKKSQYAEIKHQLPIYSELIKHKNFPIKLRNGVLVEDNVVQYDPGFTPFYLDVTYTPNAYDKEVDEFLNFASNNKEDIRRVLEEIIGHMLLVSKFPHKAFILTGTGANGKSTFLEMLNGFAGNLASHIDIEQFNDGTSIASLVGKIVNIADDIDPIYMEKTKIFKTIASGNTISVRAIYGRPFDLKNTATLIFTANEVPIFKDKSYGLERRLCIIPFENKVVNRLYNIDELLSTDNAKSYLLNLGLKGIKRIYDNGCEISYSPTIEEVTKEYKLDSDSVLAYINEYPDIDGNVVSEVYNQYKEFCEDNSLKPVSIQKFGKRLNGNGYHSRLKKIMGKPIRIYTKEK